jgi:hypothetical protein
LFHEKREGVVFRQNAMQLIFNSLRRGKTVKRSSFLARETYVLSVGGIWNRAIIDIIKFFSPELVVVVIRFAIASVTSLKRYLVDYIDSYALSSRPAFVCVELLRPVPKR